MKYQLTRHLAFAAALLIASTAYGQTQVPNTFQSGQPAMAAEVNANFSELESAANQNANDIATNAADVSSNAADIAALPVIGLESNLANQELRIWHLENDMDLVLDLVITCGDYRLYGCTQSTSANGTVFERPVFFGGIYNVAIYFDPSAVNTGDSVFFAIPVADEFDFQNLWIGGSANLTRTLNAAYSAALVDDCDNPTVQLVRAGEPPTGRLVTNNGNFYRGRPDPAGGIGPIINTVDVTGQTYGLINPQTPGNIIETCTLVTDQSGLYDVYAIDLKFNVFDGRFDSPWMHQ